MSAPKLCKYGCNQQLGWDTNGGFYTNVSNRERHRCSNYNKQGPNNNEETKPLPPTGTPSTVVDLNNLNVIKVIVAALSEYVAMKEAGLEK